MRRRPNNSYKRNAPPPTAEQAAFGAKWYVAAPCAVDDCTGAAMAIMPACKHHHEQAPAGLRAQMMTAMARRPEPDADELATVARAIAGVERSGRRAH